MPRQPPQLATGSITGSNRTNGNTHSAVCSESLCSNRSTSLVNEFIKANGLPFKCTYTREKGRILTTQKSFKAGEIIYSGPPLVTVAEDKEHPVYKEIDLMQQSYRFFYETMWYWCALACLLTHEDAAYIDQHVHRWEDVKEEISQPVDRPANYQYVRKVLKGIRDLGLPTIAEDEQFRLLTFFVPDREKWSEDTNAIVNKLGELIGWTDDVKVNWRRDFPNEDRIVGNFLSRRRFESLVQVWVHNCFEGGTDPLTYCTYFLPTFMSHSCLPNAVWHVQCDTRNSREWLHTSPSSIDAPFDEQDLQRSPSSAGVTTPDLSSIVHSPPRRRMKLTHSDAGNSGVARVSKASAPGQGSPEGTKYTDTPPLHAPSGGREPSVTLPPRLYSETSDRQHLLHQHSTVPPAQSPGTANSELDPSSSAPAAAVALAPLSASIVAASPRPSVASSASVSGSFVLLARLAVEPGDELKISYLSDQELMRPTHSRRNLLSATKHFECSCERCSLPIDTARAFLCPCCGNGAVFPPSEIDPAVVQEMPVGRLDASAELESLMTHKRRPVALEAARVLNPCKDASLLTYSGVVQALAHFSERVEEKEQPITAEGLTLKPWFCSNCKNEVPGELRQKLMSFEESLWTPTVGGDFPDLAESYGLNIAYHVAVWEITECLAQDPRIDQVSLADFREALCRLILPMPSGNYGGVLLSIFEARAQACGCLTDEVDNLNQGCVPVAVFTGDPLQCDVQAIVTIFSPFFVQVETKIPTGKIAQFLGDDRAFECAADSLRVFEDLFTRHYELYQDTFERIQGVLTNVAESLGDEDTELQQLLQFRMEALGL